MIPATAHRNIQDDPTHCETMVESCANRVVLFAPVLLLLAGVAITY
jgi:hypothetical protein